MALCGIFADQVTNMIGFTAFSKRWPSENHNMKRTKGITALPGSILTVSILEWSRTKVLPHHCGWTKLFHSGQVQQNIIMGQWVTANRWWNVNWNSLIRPLWCHITFVLYILKLKPCGNNPGIITLKCWISLTKLMPYAYTVTSKKTMQHIMVIVNHSSYIKWFNLHTCQNT